MVLVYHNAIKERLLLRVYFFCLMIVSERIELISWLYSFALIKSGNRNEIMNRIDLMVTKINLLFFVIRKKLKVERKNPYNTEQIRKGRLTSLFGNELYIFCCVAMHQKIEKRCAYTQSPDSSGWSIIIYAGTLLICMTSWSYHEKKDINIDVISGVTI